MVGLDEIAGLRDQHEGNILVNGSAQLVWANMMLHAARDPAALVARWQRALAVDGFLMFSCLGPDTLRELRAAYAAMGWPPIAGPMSTKEWPGSPEGIPQRITS